LALDERQEYNGGKICEKPIWQSRVNYIETGGIICNYSNTFMNNNIPCRTTEIPDKAKPAKFAFETIADTGHLEKIADFVEHSLNDLGIQEKYRGHICVAIDEAVTNVALYAYPKNAKGYIRITIERIKDRVLVEITDSGIAFNPLHHPVPDVTASIEKRLIGGLGVHLMRKMMDEMHYRRINNANCLSLVKHIGGPK